MQVWCVGLCFQPALITNLINIHKQPVMIYWIFSFICFISTGNDSLSGNHFFLQNTASGLNPETAAVSVSAARLSICKVSGCHPNRAEGVWVGLEVGPPPPHTNIVCLETGTKMETSTWTKKTKNNRTVFVFLLWTICIIWKMSS